MRRPLAIALLAAAAFAVILISRLPASWVVPRSGVVACAGPDGSVWSGSCSALSVERFDLGELTWEVTPLRLLTGKLAAHVVLVHGPLTGSADIVCGMGGGVTLHDLSADLRLDPRQIPRTPPQLRGTLHADLALVRIEQGRLAEIRGRVEAHDLTQRTGRVTPLGSYAVTFPGGGTEPTGTLEDLGGPLAVRGTLRLTAQPGYVLDGAVAAREGAAPELAQSLQFLGSPDSSGRRPFSIAGTF